MGAAWCGSAKEVAEAAAEQRGDGAAQMGSAQYGGEERGAGPEAQAPGADEDPNNEDSNHIEGSNSDDTDMEGSNSDGTNTGDPNNSPHLESVAAEAAGGGLDTERGAERPAGAESEQEGHRDDADAAGAVAPSSGSSTPSGVTLAASRPFPGSGVRAAAPAASGSGGGVRAMRVQPPAARTCAAAPRAQQRAARQVRPVGAAFAAAAPGRTAAYPPPRAPRADRQRQQQQQQQPQQNRALRSALGPRAAGGRRPQQGVRFSEASDTAVVYKQDREKAEKRWRQHELQEFQQRCGVGALKDLKQWVALTRYLHDEGIGLPTGVTCAQLERICAAHARAMERAARWQAGRRL
eukprot:TRINITY_DN21004_c0_g2_i1.p2 TRINITY_DN21004_c0_g2~~TRINITY_DN21004_c0_g2_i1.p2  ORF type:complete len:374 (+),score=127.46 TRINITY_DN21004_c0_g2_i1:72-1124(+)